MTSRLALLMGMRWLLPFARQQQDGEVIYGGPNLRITKEFRGGNLVRETITVDLRERCGGTPDRTRQPVHLDVVRRMRASRGFPIDRATGE